MIPSGSFAAFVAPVEQGIDEQLVRALLKVGSKPAASATLFMRTHIRQNRILIGGMTFMSTVSHLIQTAIRDLKIPFSKSNRSAARTPIKIMADDRPSRGGSAAFRKGVLVMTIDVARKHRTEQGSPTKADPRMSGPRNAAPATNPPIRQALVERAKRLLAQGYYDNTHVLAFAVARMIEEVRSRRPRRGATPGRAAREAAMAPPAGASATALRSGAAWRLPTRSGRS